MATRSVNVEREEDDLLACSICLETYKTPKYLPCLHTFCKVCINQYILSSVTKDEHGNKGFSCPVCRQSVSIGEQSSNRECWAEELPNNHLIISMIDRKALQKQEKLCNVCELSNVNQKAVSWCTVCQEALCCTCENYHRKFKMSSNHKILTLQEVQADKTTAVSGSITCEDHSDKFIEIYCVDHNKPCCTVCATVKHRKCEKVVVIEDAASGVKDSKQTTEFLELIMQWKTILDKSIEDTEKNVASVENLDNNIFSEIESLKKDLIEYVNKMEKAAKEELTITKKEILIQLTDKLTVMSSLKSTIDNWHRILSTCVKDGSDIQCLIEINKLIPMKDKIEAEIVKATLDIDEKSISFERNRVVENFEEMVKSLGQIRIESKHETIQSESLWSSSIDSVPNQKEPNCDETIKSESLWSSSIDSVPNQKKPNFDETIQSESLWSSSIDSVRNPKEPNFHTGRVKPLFTLDAGDNRWSAVCGIFTEEFIFISNLYKKKLLKFHLNGVFYSDIQFHNGPYDIAKFREDELAVAFIDSHEIQLINIHTMTIGWKIVLPVPVGGLRYINENNQFVTACDKCIVWLNATNGQKIKETKTNGNTFYICAYESNSYVYADGPNSVTCTTGASKQFTYKNQKLSSPRGIDVDFHGNLYICSNKSSNIHQISPLGKLIRIIPCEAIGTVKPWDIRFKQNSNTFLVTSLSSGRVVVAEII